MKICFITGKFRPQLCGVGDYTFFLAKALKKKGEEVYILTTTDKETFYIQNIDDIKIIRIVKKWSFIDFVRILKNVIELKMDILNIQLAHFAYNRKGTNLWICLVPLCLRFLTRTKIVSTVHEPYIPFCCSPKLILLSLWQRVILFLACAFSHRIVLTTQRWKKSLKDILVFKNVVIIPVGSNVGIKEFYNKEDIKEKKGINNNDIIIASFGTLHISKNIQLILETLRKLKEEDINFFFIWIGGNPEDEQLNNIRERLKRHGLAEKVLLTGFLTPEEIQEYLSIVDIFIAPFIDGITTRRTSVITGMEYGLPVISTFSEFTEPVFIHGENIFLINCRCTPEELKDAINAVIANDFLRKKLSRGAKETFLKEFQWDVIASKFLKVYYES